MNAQDFSANVITVLVATFNRLSSGFAPIPWCLGIGGGGWG